MSNSFKFPMFLMYVDRFKRTLNSNSQILYTILYSEITDMSNVVHTDSSGQFYFNFTVKELGQLLNTTEYSTAKAIRLLEEANLLKQVKNKNEARLYLLDPELTSNEIRLMNETIEKSEKKFIQIMEQQQMQIHGNEGM